MAVAAVTRPGTGDVERRAYKLAEVQKMMPLGRTRLYEEVNSGRLRTFRIGRATFVAVEDFEAWLSQYRGEAA